MLDSNREGTMNEADTCRTYVLPKVNALRDAQSARGRSCPRCCRPCWIGRLRESCDMANQEQLEILCQREICRLMRQNRGLQA
jgi:hypothetical protein